MPAKLALDGLTATFLSQATSLLVPSKAAGPTPPGG